MTYQISVITVSYNHRHTIARCLEPLIDADPPLEVIVVDNASMDESAAFVRESFPSVTLIESHHNGGFGAGCNLGARAARGDILMFLNPDAQASPEALYRLVEFLDQHPRVAAVGPQIYRGDLVEFSCRPFPGYQQVLFHRYSLLTKLFPKNPISARYLLSDWSHDSSRSVDWISGSAMAIRRTAFEQIGGFDETYFLFCEDTDLCHRFWDAGWEVWFTPDSQVHHDIGESMAAGSIRSLFQRHRSIWLYYRKFHSGNILKDSVTALGVGLRFIVYSVIFGLRRLSARAGLS